MTGAKEKWTPHLIESFVEAIELHDLEHLSYAFNGPSVADCEGNISPEFTDWLHRQRLEIFEAAVESARKITIVTQEQDGLHVLVDETGYFFLNEKDTQWATGIVEPKLSALKKIETASSPWKRFFPRFS